jgi:hypothetical protein
MVGCKLPILAPGKLAMASSAAFNPCTIYNNRYARDGNNNTTTDKHKIRNAAGITRKLVSRKQVENCAK